KKQRQPPKTVYTSVHNMPQRSEATQPAFAAIDLITAPAVVARCQQDQGVPRAGKVKPMESYYLDWANLLLRWVHVITAIAWIRASFSFLMLDNSLEQPHVQGSLD